MFWAFVLPGAYDRATVVTMDLALRHSCWETLNTFLNFLGLVFPRFLKKEVLRALKMKEF